MDNKKIDLSTANNELSPLYLEKLEEAKQIGEQLGEQRGEQRGSAKYCYSSIKKTCRRYLRRGISKVDNLIFRAVRRLTRCSPRFYPS